MRWVLAILAAAMSVACSEQPVSAYRDVRDRVWAMTGLPIIGVGPCARAWNDDTFEPKKSMTEICYKLEPRKRWRGLWRNEFEGSQFCPSPARKCEFVMSEDRVEPRIWLDFAGPLRFKGKRPPQGLYEVEFLGRRSLVRGSYGHMGAFDEEVIVDRMIAIKELDPPHSDTVRDRRNVTRE